MLSFQEKKYDILNLGIYSVVYLCLFISFLYDIFHVIPGEDYFLNVISRMADPISFSFVFIALILSIYFVFIKKKSSFMVGIRYGNKKKYDKYLFKEEIKYVNILFLINLLKYFILVNIFGGINITSVYYYGMDIKIYFLWIVIRQYLLFLSITYLFTCISNYINKYIPLFLSIIIVALMLFSPYYLNDSFNIINLTNFTYLVKIVLFNSFKYEVIYNLSYFGILTLLGFITYNIYYFKKDKSINIPFLLQSDFYTFKTKIKKINIIYFLVFLFFIISFKILEYQSGYNNFFIVLGIDYSNGLLQSINYLLNIFYFCYIAIYLFIYSFSDGQEFVMLRINKIKWLLKKILNIIIIILIVRLFYYLFTFIFFMDLSIISELFKYIIYDIIYMLCISLGAIIFIILNKIFRVVVVLLLIIFRKYLIFSIVKSASMMCLFLLVLILFIEFVFLLIYFYINSNNIYERMV